MATLLRDSAVGCQAGIEDASVDFCILQHGFGLAVALSLTMCQFGPGDILANARSLVRQG